MNELTAAANAADAQRNGQWGEDLAKRIDSGLVAARRVARSSLVAVRRAEGDYDCGVTVSLDSGADITFGSAFPHRLETTLQEWRDTRLKVNDEILLTLTKCPEWKKLVRALADGQDFNIPPEQLALMSSTTYAPLFFDYLMEQPANDIERVAIALRKHRDPFSAKIREFAAIRSGGLRTVEDVILVLRRARAVGIVGCPHMGVGR